VAPAPVVTLVTDFGLRDEFAGVVEGVIVRTAPRVRVVHVTHGISPTDVLGGMLALASAVPYLPAGVHLAVVDPGVGSERRALVVATTGDALLVGPDNGLLLPAAEALGGATSAWTIDNADLFLEPVAPTFHGRDVFAPVAARLADGLAPGEVGPAVDLADLVRVEVPPIDVRDGVLQARVLLVDRFGNMGLNARPGDLDAVGIAVGGEVEVTAGEGRFLARRARTFTDVRYGDMVVYDDASGWVGIAVNGSSAAAAAGVASGDAVEIEPR
jgi:S-adenosylmethionine hydrolase